MNCSLGRGKLLIPLGAGCNWLLNDHSGLKISITDGDHQPPPKADAGISFITIANINSFNQVDCSVKK